MSDHAVFFAEADANRIAVGVVLYVIVIICCKYYILKNSNVV